MGWAEANVVQILDPDNYWFDPKGKTFRIFLRALTGHEQLWGNVQGGGE